MAHPDRASVYTSPTSSREPQRKIYWSKLLVWLTTVCMTLESFGDNRIRPLDSEDPSLIALFVAVAQSGLQKWNMCTGGATKGLQLRKKVHAGTERRGNPFNLVINSTRNCSSFTYLFLRHFGSPWNRSGVPGFLWCLTNIRLRLLHCT